MANPYEIRADLLKQAQELLQAQYDFNYKVFVEATKVATAAICDAEKILPKIPNFPSTEDIIKEADKFYSFVCKGWTWILSLSSKHCLKANLALTSSLKSMHQRLQKKWNHWLNSMTASWANHPSTANTTSSQKDHS